MYSLIEHKGEEQYNLKDFVCDTENDIQYLPTDCLMGSTAFIIATSEAYMLNSKKEWVKI